MGSDRRIQQPCKYGTKVYNQLKKAGYTVYAVNPALRALTEILAILLGFTDVPDAVASFPPKITEQDSLIRDVRPWNQSYEFHELDATGSESEEAIRRWRGPRDCCDS